jgi:hypothetical protein
MSCATTTMPMTSRSRLAEVYTNLYEFEGRSRLTTWLPDDGTGAQPPCINRRRANLAQASPSSRHDHAATEADRLAELVSAR